MDSIEASTATTTKTMRGMLINNKFVQGELVDGEFVKAPKADKPKVRRIKESKTRGVLRAILFDEKSAADGMRFRRALMRANPKETNGVMFEMTVEVEETVDEEEFRKKMDLLMPEYKKKIAIKLSTIHMGRAAKEEEKRSAEDGGHSAKRSRYNE